LISKKNDLMSLRYEKKTRGGEIFDIWSTYTPHTAQTYGRIVLSPIHPKQYQTRLKVCVWVRESAFEREEREREREVEKDGVREREE